MKITESIFIRGNIINTEYGILPVHAIVWNDIQVKGNGNRTLWAKQVEPVKLTEEWLIKFGFKKKPCGYGSSKYVYGIFEVHNYGGNRFKNIELITIDKSNDEDEIVNTLLPVDILYVHQLQNLYLAITGEKLKQV
ncbi:hypothetical protein [Sunxiuqinia indica]|uniref:hypothetical protein n=1 Tax=Sunxiuqinia indica TaxID=2692584 RepID=UPI00135ACF11|nr:hypothetical protein [Sunxiuqinia indica]